MAATQPEKRDRVRRALAGHSVDRPPVGFWAHNYARENSPEELAAETVDRFRRFDWDFIKIQPRASSFAEDWGSRYRPSTQPAVPPVLLSRPIRSTAELRALRPVAPMRGALGEQIEALRIVRREVGPEVPILQTVFAPAMVLSYLVGESPKGVLELLRGYPTETLRALGAISFTLVEYAQACLENGADGIFFAVTAASAAQMAREEYARFGLPFDLRVLEAASRGWINTLHLCGAGLHFEVVDFLPSAVVNWALGPGNPSLSEGRDRARRAVLGGVSADPRIREMSPEEVAAEVEAALKDTGGVRLLVGPGCALPPDTPEELLHAAREAVER